MKGNRFKEFPKTLFINLAVVCVVILVTSSTASAGTGVKLTDMSGHQEDAAIHGDTVVYVDRSGKYSQIRTINLETGEVRVVPNHGADQQRPDVYGDKVVYEDKRGEATDIYLYDLSTGEETRITKNDDDPVSSQAKAYPRIFKNWVVYCDYKNTNGGYDIYAYNLETGETKEVSVGEFTRYDPAIYGAWVVYVDYSGKYGEDDVRVGGINAFNLNTGEGYRIAGLPVYQADPEVYGTRVVWEDKRNGQTDSDIFIYDLETENETKITANINDQFDPAIWSNLVVYDDWRAGKENIYVYDTETGEETKLTVGDTRYHDPVVHGDVVVYEAFNEGEQGIDLRAYFLNEENRTFEPDTGSKRASDASGGTGGDGGSGDPLAIYVVPAFIGLIGVYFWRSS